MTDYSYTQNRELSWLNFNERVLEEATSDDTPLFEKLKFLAIFASNLDEFFMVRVGSITDLSLVDKDHIDPKTGMSDKEQLSKIYARVRELYPKFATIYDSTKEKLALEGIALLHYEELSKDLKKKADLYFELELFPLLSPQIIDARHPFPHLANKRLYVIFELTQKGKSTIGLVPCLGSQRLIFLDDNTMILSEDVIINNLHKFFSSANIGKRAIISVTRNADIDLDGNVLDDMEDYRSQIKNTIKKRGRLRPVRLEVSGELKDDIEHLLKKKLNLKQHQIYKIETPLNVSFLYQIIKKYEKYYPHFIYPPFKGIREDKIIQSRSLIDYFSVNDTLLHYPYDDIKIFIDLLKEAAQDDRVVSIKITLYRLADPSKIVDALLTAKENGKDVVVLIELKARFDENNNIKYSEMLQEAGCSVYYGFEDYKVHSKICLITYRQSHNIKHLIHVATGNYNEKTARLYTDLGLITKDPFIANDANNFFQNMATGNLEGHYDHLLVAPNSFKTVLVNLIDKEIKKGTDGYICFKINSLSDNMIIEKLKEASMAGVKVELIVRGIICLLPRIPQKTENIKAISVVGRFLEHSRVYIFAKGKDAKVYISSADMMSRNLDHRVEIACPIYDKDLKKRITDIIEIYFQDNVKAREILGDGNYHIIQSDKPRLIAQEYFVEDALKRSKEKARLSIFQKIFKK